MTVRGFQGFRVLGLKVGALVLAVLLAGEAQAQAADSAQTRVVQILRADSLAGAVEAGQRIQRLVGDVQLRQEETYLSSDRVTRYLDRDEILFTGRVLIVERGDSLAADRVLYNTQTKVGRARGNVRLSDGEVVVFAPAGLYYTEEKRSVFDEGVTLVDSATVLTSERGRYWSDEKRAEFYEDVRLEEDQTVLTADSVTYFRETEVSVGRHAVVVERLGSDDASADTTTRTLLFGDYAYNDNARGYSRTEGRPLLVQIRADSAGAPADTLLIRARILEATREDSLRRLVAIDSVRIWQPELAAVADSAVYDRFEPERAEGAGSLSAPDEKPAVREETRLFGTPLAWNGEAQLSGDTLRVTAKDGTVDSLFAADNAFVAQRDTLLDRIQQLQGRTLVGIFGPGEGRRLRLGPNAEAIRYLVRDGRADGAVQLSADSLQFFFEGDSLRRVEGLLGVEGTQYAESLLPATLQLSGYRWVPERRPEKAALLEGVTIPPPIVRAAPEVPRIVEEAPAFEWLEPEVPRRVSPRPPALRGRVIEGFTRMPIRPAQQTAPTCVLERNCALAD